MKINKKALGSNVRRGVLTGTVAGFFAGWLAFAGHAKQFAAAEYEAQQDVSKTAADLLLPPVPDLPAMPKLPSNPTYRIATGPNTGLPQLSVPRFTSQAGTAPTVSTPNAPAPAANAPAPVNNAPAPVNNAPAPAAPAPAAPAPVAAPPAPAPVFAPLPTLAPAPPKPAPKPTTAPSAPWP